MLTMVRRLAIAVLLALLPLAAFASDVETAVTAYRAGDHAAAVRIIRPLAAKGNPAAQSWLGIFFRQGHGVDQNDVEAVKWMRRAAEQGRARAEANLGLMYLEGRGVARDPVMARSWFQRAATQGDAPAQYQLGAIYFNGQGVTQDYREAVRWWHQAAKQEHGRAQLALAHCLQHGFGETRNLDDARFWLLSAIRNLPTGDSRNLAEVRLREVERELAQPSGSAARSAPTERPRERSDLPRGGKLTVHGSGTGFYVTKNGHVLTNQHVVEGCTEIRTNRPGAGVATMIFASKAVDLAVLKTPGRSPTHATWRSGPIRLGEDVIVFGYPLAGALASSGNVSSGIVASLHGLQDDPRQMQISAPTQSGNSGAPVLDSLGNVVGVVVSKLSAAAVFAATGVLPENVNFAIRQDTAEAFLRQAKVPIDHATPSRRLSTADIAEKAQSFTVRIECWR